MKLIDAVFAIGEMSEESCIYCKRPFHQSSDAVIALPGPEGGAPREVSDQGFEYFLEREEVQELLQAAEGKLKSRAAKVELVVYYAEFDASPAWFNDMFAS